MAGEGKERTMTVRLAIAVRPNGHWNSAGWSGIADETKLALASAGVFANGAGHYLVDVEVPVPLEGAKQQAPQRVVNEMIGE